MSPRIQKGGKSILKVLGVVLISGVSGLSISHSQTNYQGVDLDKRLTAIESKQSELERIVTKQDERFAAIQEHLKILRDDVREIRNRK